MIIFYNKKTGDIFGTIGGRVHDDDSKKMSIHPSNVKESDVGRWETEYKQTFKTEIQPIYELRVIDKDTMRVGNVKIGEKRVKVPAGLKPAGKLAKFTKLFEEKPGELFKYGVKLDKQGKVIGFIKKR